VLYRLYSKVANDPNLKNKIKFIGVAQQDQTAVNMWEKVNSVPFAVVPDTDSKLSSAIKFGAVPVTLLVDKSGKVLWVEVGQMDDSDIPKAFNGIKNAIK
jgi:hypothetical protein